MAVEKPEQGWKRDLEGQALHQLKGLRSSRQSSESKTECRAVMVILIHLLI